MITIIDYKAGNLTSVKRGLDSLGLENQISADPLVVSQAERLIFPGVGQASAAMSVLKQRGLDEAIRTAFARGVPILGICIGCQIILDHSEEGDTACLGLLPGHCLRFLPTDPGLKIPHMGWNAVTPTRPHPLLAHLRPGDEFYFVHSFYPQPDNPTDVYAVTDYGGNFPAAIGRDNLFAVQFHTEKSAAAGLQVLSNFAKWKP